MRSEGIQQYTNFYLHVYMPAGKEACKYCPCIKYDNDSNTRRCKLTWELLPYPDTSIGQLCVLTKELISKNIKED